MINLNLLILFFIIATLCNFIVMRFGLRLSINKKRQIQNIHHGDISRLGGFSIFLVFSLYVIFFNKSLILFCFFSLIVIIPALLEDINITIAPKKRFLLIIFACALIILSLDQLPNVDLKFVSFFNNYYFQIIFYSLALATLINGQNIIDGTNGLSALTSLSIFGSLLYIGMHLNNIELINNCLIIITLLISFLLFNYPFGKIFLGDTGSYFIGLLAGYLIIKIFGQYPQLSSYSAVVIVFYPCLEIIFSYLRRIIKNKSPFIADNLHLHYKMYFLLKGNNKPSFLHNALVAPLLGIIWLSPIALIPFIVNIPYLSIVAVVILVILYLFMYFIIPNPKKDISKKI